MNAVLQAPISYVATRRLTRPGLSRAQFDLAQTRAIDRWLARSVPRVRAFAGAPARLQDLPQMNKAALMADFAAYNLPALTTDQVRAAMARDFRVGRHIVGASTGTSGNRGLFVISEAERFRWLGTMLAKTMSDLLWRQQRVAIVLPQGTALYDSANVLWQLRLRFFDLTRGPEDWQHSLQAFDPTVIVAPPKVLRHMAEQNFRLRPVRVFSAAETLDPVDRQPIEAAFGTPLEQIYMATEGLLAVTCRHGTLHLAEDSVHFELEPADGGLVTPLITSFRRDTQILARYRMNDLLRLATDPCPCGSPLQPVAEVVGRMDDCFILLGRSGRRLITPDVLRNAVLKADARITDFRIVQTGAQDIVLTLPPQLPPDAAASARADLQTLLDDRDVTARVTLHRAHLPLDLHRKLRRVERRFDPDDRS